MRDRQCTSARVFPLHRYAEEAHLESSPSIRALLKRPQLIVAPGVYDALTAKLAEQAGFAAVYMTGAGTAPHAAFPILAC